MYMMGNLCLSMPQIIVVLHSDWSRCRVSQKNNWETPTQVIQFLHASRNFSKLKQFSTICAEADSDVMFSPFIELKNGSSSARQDGKLKTESVEKTANGSISYKI